MSEPKQTLPSFASLPPPLPFSRPVRCFFPGWLYGVKEFIVSTASGLRSVLKYPPGDILPLKLPLKYPLGDACLGGAVGSIAVRAAWLR